MYKTFDQETCCNEWMHCYFAWYEVVQRQRQWHQYYTFKLIGLSISIQSKISLKGISYSGQFLVCPHALIRSKAAAEYLTLVLLLLMDTVKVAQ